MIGLVSLVRPAVSTIALAWAALTALTIGTYTTIDIEGARRSTGFGYGIALMLGAGIAVSIAGVAHGRGARSSARSRPRGAATRSAVPRQPSRTRWSWPRVGSRRPGYVAALRESSVVLGALGGWVLLHERLGRARVISAAVVAAGLALLVVLR